MKRLFFVFITCCGFYCAQAQISSATLEMNTLPNNDPYAEVDSSGMPLPYHVASMVVNLTPAPPEAEEGEVPVVVKLHTKLGSSSGADNFKNKVFDMAAPGAYEDGTSLGIADGRVYLVFGAFHYEGVYYAEVKAELSDGSFSEVYGDESP